MYKLSVLIAAVQKMSCCIDFLFASVSLYCIPVCFYISVLYDCLSLYLCTVYLSVSISLYCMTVCLCISVLYTCLFLYLCTV